MGICRKSMWGEKKKWIYYCGVLIVGLWFSVLKFDWFLFKSPYPHSVVIGNTRYALEIADTDKERARGLSGRESLCQYCALLFIFPEKGQWAFWMKDMRFSIDILWFSGDTLVGIEQNLSPSSKDIFRPAEGADRVIEMNAGSATDFHVGDTVRYEY